MGRMVLRVIGCAAILATMHCWVANGRAECFNSTSMAALSQSRMVAFDSWIPYRTEFREVAGCLESALKLRGDSHAVLTASSGNDPSMLASSHPVSKTPLNLNHHIDNQDQSADPASGTSAPSGAERNSQPQTCLLVAKELAHIEIISTVIADSKVTPGRPFHPDIFHPPRPHAF